MNDARAPVVWFEKLRRVDVARVGGKNSSLGEMIQTLQQEGVDVPPGFATTADAYWDYVDENGIRDAMVTLTTDWIQGRAAWRKPVRPYASFSSAASGQGRRRRR